MSIQELNQHPLNQAALHRLMKENQGPDTRLIHLLTLAHAAMVMDEEPVDPFSPEGKILTDWGAGRNLQAEAVEELDGAMDPEEIENLSLPQLAERIVGTLRGAQCRGDER